MRPSFQSQLSRFLPLFLVLGFAASTRAFPRAGQRNRLLLNNRMHERVHPLVLQQRRQRQCQQFAPQPKRNPHYS